MAGAGGRRVLALAVCTANGVTPCGACRQVLSEFVDHEGDAPVWIVDGGGEGAGHDDPEVAAGSFLGRGI